MWIDFDCDDSTCDSAEGFGQNPTSWTNLKHGFPGLHISQRDDLAHDVRINEKMLTEGFSRRKCRAIHLTGLTGFWQRRPELHCHCLEGRAVKVHDIRKFFEQVVRERGAWLLPRERLPLIFSKGLTQQSGGPCFPFRHPLGTRHSVEILRRPLGDLV